MISQAEISHKIQTNYLWKGSRLECSAASGLRLRLEVVSNEIFRFRYSTQPYFDKDFSYAVDPDFQAGDISVVFKEQVDFWIVSTESVVCQINKLDLNVTILDSDNKIICKDEKGFHRVSEENRSNEIVALSKEIQKGEVFYGLGDKPTNLNLLGKKVSNWGTDAYGFEKDRDPLYKNIPFYYGLHNGKGYGIFFDNSFKTFFDFGNVEPGTTRFWAEGGEMNYYFIAGPGLIDVAKRYALLTGTPEMPALWSLGFQQCKWSYYPEAEVRRVCSAMRKYKIPCDAIYLDIDYMDGFRCFTWDNNHFPDPKGMIRDLKKNGFKTVVIIDPGIKIDMDYSIFTEGLENDYFCRRKDGPYVTGIVWPGECHFPDFTKVEVRKWWGGLYKELIGDLDVAGVWNDMNEPALFEIEGHTFPMDARHDYDGHACSHEKGHNVYGMQMARASCEGVRQYNRGNRSLIITRSGYAGMQRYSSTWTGDNLSTWNHLWLANVQCQRLSISGVSFTGSDIGGFVGTPTSELFVRWIQLGIFHPLCRVHSSQDDGDQEPWSFGEETTRLFRAAIELRYQLLPYHYTAFYQYHKFGIPVLKPISFYDQKNTETHYRNNEFICGDHILTASVLEAGLEKMTVYLPKGSWYNFWDDQKYEGRKALPLNLTPDIFPFFIKAGSVIPMYPVQQFVGEKSFDEITLRVYYKKGKETSHLYEDAHDGEGYKTGEFKLSTFEVRGTKNSLTLYHSAEGTYDTPYRFFKITIIGLPFVTKTITINGERSDAKKMLADVHFSKLEIRGK